MSIYRARLRNTSNALSPRVSGEQMRLQVPPKLFGVDSWVPQTIGQWIPDCVGPATEKARVTKVPRRTRGTNSWWRLAVSQIADAGDQELQTLARNNRRGNLELGAEDNDGLSQQACTALAVFCFQEFVRTKTEVHSALMMLV